MTQRHPKPTVALTGTGSPEGNVAAPVGSVYTDTAATNGAIRWIKASGTGVTGWRDDYGDTTAALETKADKGHKHDSSEITDTANTFGGTSAANKIIRANQNGKLTIWTADITLGTDPANKLYVDTATADIRSTTSGLGAAAPNKIVRTNPEGQITVYHGSIVADNDVVNKRYVDTKTEPLDTTISALGSANAYKVLRTNENGQVTVFDSAVQRDTDIPNKKYVDTAVAAVTGAVGGVEWSPFDDVIFWGDSLIAGTDNTNGQWDHSLRLANQTGQYITNETQSWGAGGDTSDSVLIRSGARPVWAMPEGGVIPASGTVPVDLGGVDFVIRPNWNHPGSIAGVLGNLRHIADGAWEFTRTTDGEAVTVTEPTRFSYRFEQPYGPGTHVFMFGTNDLTLARDNGVEWAGGTEADVVDHLCANMARAIESVKDSRGRHVLVSGIKSNADILPGDWHHQATTEINDRLRRMFPGHFIDRQHWLATRALDAAGITPTADDLVAMEAGMCPPSAHEPGDTAHLRQSVVAAEALELWAPALTGRGWAREHSGQEA